MIIYKRRRVSFKGISKYDYGTRYGSTFILNKVQYYSPHNNSNDIDRSNLHRFYFSHDGANKLKDTFLGYHHFFRSYEFNYRTDKDYDELTQHYLLFVLDPLDSPFKKPLWKDPNGWELFDKHVSNYDLIAPDSTVKHKLKSFQKKMLFQLASICVIVVVFGFMVPLVEVDVNSVSSLYALIFLFSIIQAMFLKRINDYHALIGAMNVVFKLPVLNLYRFFITLSSFGWIMINLSMIRFSLDYAGLNYILILYIILMSVLIGWYLMNLYFYLFHKNQRLF